MTPDERRQQIALWMQRSSSTEQDRQERALRMVQKAIDDHPALGGVNLRVYAKGSYANQTNVRVDSDVDIVVECHECVYFDYHDPSWAPSDTRGSYTGAWTPASWRKEVTAAIVNAFGSSGVDISGNVALNIFEVAGSRPSTDVVPSFLYERYDTANRSATHPGSKVFKKDGSGSIINYPAQQLTNGNIKDKATHGRYKSFVRVLKNAENRLVTGGIIEAKPSYLMECLMYNVPNVQFFQRTTDGDAFQVALLWLHANLAEDTYDHDHWREPNELKWLFGSHQKWTVADAREVVLRSWAYLYN